MAHPDIGWLGAKNELLLFNDKFWDELFPGFVFVLLWTNGELWESGIIQPFDIFFDVVGVSGTKKLFSFSTVSLLLFSLTMVNFTKICPKVTMSPFSKAYTTFGLSLREPLKVPLLEFLSMIVQTSCKKIYKLCKGILFSKFTDCLQSSRSL